MKFSTKICLVVPAAYAAAGAEGDVVVSVANKGSAGGSFVVAETYAGTGDARPKTATINGRTALSFDGEQGLQFDGFAPNSSRVEEPLSEKGSSADLFRYAGSVFWFSGDAWTVTGTPDVRGNLKVRQGAGVISLRNVPNGLSILVR